jgi:hypothetical protein
MTETDLSAGVPYAERIRLLEAIDPEAHAELMALHQAHVQTDRQYRESRDRYRLNLGLVRNPVRSKQQIAFDAAVKRGEELIQGAIDAGRYVYAGHRTGDLSGSPEPIPLHAGLRWKDGHRRCIVRDTTYHDVRLYPAAAIKGPGDQREKAELDTETPSRAVFILTEGDCFVDLVEIFRADPKKRLEKPRVLLPLLIERNPAYGTFREVDTVKGWIRNQKDNAAEKAADTG